MRSENTIILFLNISMSDYWKDNSCFFWQVLGCRYRPIARLWISGDILSLDDMLPKMIYVLQFLERIRSL